MSTSAVACRRRASDVTRGRPPGRGRSLSRTARPFLCDRAGDRCAHRATATCRGRRIVRAARRGCRARGVRARLRGRRARRREAAARSAPKPCWRGSRRPSTRSRRFAPACCSATEHDLVRLARRHRRAHRAPRGRARSGRCCSTMARAALERSATHRVVDHSPASRTISTPSHPRRNAALGRRPDQARAIRRSAPRRLSSCSRRFGTIDVGIEAQIREVAARAAGRRARPGPPTRIADDAGGRA